ncbi:MAG TPA: hypothetical protein VGF28_22830 [Thermoanaerobaculia bacterium]
MSEALYLLECWETRARDGVRPFCVYSDSVSELRLRAEVILEEGRYRYLTLSRWVASTERWDEKELFEAG